MTRKKFEEVHPELYDYFVLADLDTLEEFQREQRLPYNLLERFITDESGDRVIEQGVIVALAGVSPDYYNVVFSLDESPLLEEADNRVLSRHPGFRLRVLGDEVHLFGAHFLTEVTPPKRRLLEDLHAEYRKPRLKLEQGWYSLTILTGLIGEHREPSYEFVLQQRAEEPPFEAPLNQSFTIPERPREG